MFTTRRESPSFAGVSGQVTQARPRTLQPPGSRSGPTPRLGFQRPPAPGPRPLAHPVCVLGLVGNGLWLHDGGAAAAHEGAGKGRRDATEGNEGKLADTLALWDPQVSKLFLTCGRRAWGPPCWRRGGAWEGHVGGRRGRSRRTLGGAREVEAPAGG